MFTLKRWNVDGFAALSAASRENFPSVREGCTRFCARDSASVAVHVVLLRPWVREGKVK